MKSKGIIKKINELLQDPTTDNILKAKEYCSTSVNSYWMFINEWYNNPTLCDFFIKMWVLKGVEYTYFVELRKTQTIFSLKYPTIHNESDVQNKCFSISMYRTKNINDIYANELLKNTSFSIIRNVENENNIEDVRDFVLLFLHKLLDMHY